MEIVPSFSYCITTLCFSCICLFFPLNVLFLAIAIVDWESKCIDIDWESKCTKLSQVVKYSKVRMSNPHRLCLYLDWCKFNLEARDKEFKIKDKER